MLVMASISAFLLLVSQAIRLFPPGLPDLGDQLPLPQTPMAKQLFTYQATQMFRYLLQSTGQMIPIVTTHDRKPAVLHPANVCKIAIKSSAKTMLKGRAGCKTLSLRYVVLRSLFGLCNCSMQFGCGFGPVESNTFGWVPKTTCVLLYAISKTRRQGPDLLHTRLLSASMFVPTLSFCVRDFLRWC